MVEVSNQQLTSDTSNCDHEERRHRQIHGLSKKVAIMTLVGLTASLVVLSISLFQMFYARQSLHAVQRAFVSRTGIAIKHYPGYLAFTVHWINNGATQTVDAVDQVACAEVQTFKADGKSKTRISLAPKQERPGAYCKLLDTGSFVTSGGNLILLLRIRYDDVFHAHHIYSECADYVVPPEANETDTFDVNNCSGYLDKYNCVDDECKGDAANW